MKNDALTTEEARLTLRLDSLQTVRAYIRRGWLRGHKIGRQWLISQSSLNQLTRDGVPCANSSTKKARK